jgi:hypothetical protein
MPARLAEDNALAQPSPASRERSTDIRAWAKDQGIAVSDHGRIPTSIVEQYQATTAR